MSEIDTLRQSLDNATAHVMPRADVADRAIHGAVKVRHRRRAGAIGGTALAAVMAAGLVAVLPRGTSPVRPAAPSASAQVPPCPTDKPLGCGLGWAARGPRTGDRALFDRATARSRGSGFFGEPRTLWAGDLPDGRALVIYETPDRETGAFRQHVYVERDGREDVQVNRVSFSTDPVWFTTYVGGSPGYAVALAPPGTTEIEFALGSGEPMRAATVRDGLAVLAAPSEAAADDIPWRYRIGRGPWQLTDLSYLPPKESS